MITVKAALDQVLALARLMPGETVPLDKAAGRRMAEPAVATRPQPPFDAGAMDGYALKGPVAVGDRFHVIGEAGAGHGFAGHIGHGQTARIFTGAPVPLGADHIVLQEHVTRTGDDIVIAEASSGTNIRPMGGDFRQGQALAPRCISPRDLALLAAMNIAQPMVRRRPKVAIIATGDELVLPGHRPGPDQIITSNNYALAALAEQYGAVVELLPIARDSDESLRRIFALAQGADVIVTIGGASVGDHDLVGKVAADLGMERAFYKVAMRPGKPLMAGRLGEAVLLGLPGNPVSSIVCGHLFMVPLILAMLGDPNPEPVLKTAILGHDLGPNGPRTHYMRAKIAENGACPPVITVFEDQDSSLLTILSQANALLVRAMDAPACKAGDLVDYLPL